MQILVTGGAGFVGSHLVRKLLELNFKVTVIDNFSTGDIRNIEDILVNKNLELIHGDITEKFEIETDMIVNLACPASPPMYQSMPIETMKANVIGSLNLLELAVKNKARILQSSTSEVYGDPKISPQSEEYWGNVNMIGIRSCYDEGKRAAETLFMDFHRQLGVDIRIARIFNTYGPRMAIDDGRVVSNFINQALMNEPLTVYGNGLQTRSLCYVTDLVEGLIELLMTEKQYTPINIGNPEPISMLNLAKEIIAITKSQSKIVFHPLPSDDPIQREPNIEKALRILNWGPQVPREEGLIKTVKYFRELQNVSRSHLSE